MHNRSTTGWLCFVWLPLHLDAAYLTVLGLAYLTGRVTEAKIKEIHSLISAVG